MAYTVKTILKEKGKEKQHSQTSYVHFWAGAEVSWGGDLVA